MQRQRRVQLNSAKVLDGMIHYYQNQLKDFHDLYRSYLRYSYEIDVLRKVLSGESSPKKVQELSFVAARFPQVMVDVERSPKFLSKSQEQAFRLQEKEASLQRLQSHMELMRCFGGYQAIRDLVQEMSESVRELYATIAQQKRVLAITISDSSARSTH